MSVKMAGQTMTDRLLAARHSIAGQGLAKSVCKATTEELIGPKKKHLDYLIHCTNEPNVSIPQLANLLIERSQNSSWVVVFKALITVHHLMCYGNERFTQYLASSNCTFQLSNFLDKSGVQGYDMSPFIRKYAKYLNEKAMSYRTVAFDFCKVKRGKEDGVLRTLTGEKLLKTIPVLQAQLDALLDFDCTPADLSNGVINMAFMMLFRDLIRLFAGYNDSIINLLEKFFEMNKKQCRQALDLYKKFLIRMDRVGEFLKVAENAGIDKGEIPDLTKAPSSLLDALEQHLNALEGKRAPTAGTPTQTNVIIDSSSKVIDKKILDVSLEEIEEDKYLYIEVDSDLDDSQYCDLNLFNSQKFMPASPTNPFFHELLWTVSKKFDAKKSQSFDSLSNPFLYSEFPCQRTDVKSAVSALNTTSSSFGSAVQNSEIGVEEALALAEEEAAINHFKSKVQSPTGQPATNPFLVSSPTQPIVDLFSAPAGGDPTQMGGATKASDDLLQLGNPFADIFGGPAAPQPAIAPAAVAPQSAIPSQNNNLWMSNGFTTAAATAPPVTNSFVPESAFNSVFGSTNTNSTQAQAEGMGGQGQVVNPFTGLPEEAGPAPPRPPPPSAGGPPPRPVDQPILADLNLSLPQTSSPAHNPVQPPESAATTGKVLTGDLDTSLALLAENLTINKSATANKGNMQWNSPKNTAKPGQPPAWNPQPMAATTTANYRPMGQGMMAPSPFPSMQPMGMMGGSPRMQQPTPQPQPLDPFGAL